MCEEALPEHIDEPSEWKGTDHDNWLFRWFIPIKLKYLCFGPRDSHKWHKWREWPIVLFAKGSKDIWRIEDDVSDEGRLTPKPFPEEYLSRIQYWKRWHIAIQWPFFLVFHFYFRQKDVPQYPHHVTPDGLSTDGKLFYFYFGAHRDADKVYWIPSVFIGLTWK